MDRQTLDMEGSRRGEISSASLQLGDDTIAIQCIATMSVESMEFAPWDTPANRRAKSIHASLFVINLFFGLLALAWGGLFPGSNGSIVALGIGALLGLIALVLGIRAVMIARRMKMRQPYYRLVIGASDGRRIPLVDNNHDVLRQIRDVVRHKMDTGDREIQGDFDLDLDIVNLRTPAAPSRRSAALAAKTADPAPLTADAGDADRPSEPDVLFDQDPEDVRNAS